MTEHVARRGFDWDRDQESLLETRDIPVAQPEAVAAGPRWPSLLNGRMGLFALGLIFALALAYEKDLTSQFRSGSTLSFGIVPASAPMQSAIPVPDGLVAYSEGQAQRYLRDLRLADMQTLHDYIARTNTDLAKAEPGLRPFYQDAQTLLMTELARRSANAS
ncbi:hypothetical protein [Roseibaca sp. Y0-43]|uniref:hypothetical protein n=1 Tax=Roseibaca sp. Y0-43 TaxID=2816854 RepID=UPI001D0CA2F4|nr:hypothetical protein [Roseibaca sp. Y0-43]MCC1481126.1 hypothetical protein [Roseibaca sp. Y0-43]